VPTGQHPGGTGIDLTAFGYLQQALADAERIVAAQYV
jgi:hypothetical protein